MTKIFLTTQNDLAFVVFYVKFVNFSLKKPASGLQRPALKTKLSSRTGIA
jgi:hypothetical protein